MNKSNINFFFKILEKNNPNPTTELEYSSNFELLVAVVLSAQATDKSVNLATRKLFKIANTPDKILALGETGLKNHIKSIGLFNSKAKNIIKTCEILLQQYYGKVPNSREELETLPGVGRKTANVVLNTAFNKNTIAVDTHIFRVGNRTGLAKGKTPLEVEKQLLNKVPNKYLKNAHHWLILLGRYICVTRKPKCDICPVQQYCNFIDKNL